MSGMPEKLRIVERVPAVVEPATAFPAGAIPAVIAGEGPEAAERFFTFFTDTIRNKNTRAAYYRNARRFFEWARDRGLALKEIKSFHVSAFIEELSQTHSAPSVKQNLATIRMLFDWMILGQVVELNPAQAVRGPKHVVKKGKTPVLDEDEARTLLTSIDVSNLVGLRDRALIAVCLYSFARIEAALGMAVGDYFPQGKRWWFRLHEKGGQQGSYWKRGTSAKEKMTTSSPVTVLMSWCMLNTFTPATSWTSDSNIGRANSSSCFRTCLMRSLPFSGDNDFPSCRSARVKTPRMRTTKRSLMKWV